MSEYCVIRLRSEDQPVEWMLADSSGTRGSELRRGSLHEAAADVGERQVIVLVPAEDVISTTINIPARSPSRIRATLPFALEEDLAEDVDNLHFALGDRNESGRHSVAVVAHELMRNWLLRLAEVGIEAAIVTPEYQGLAKIPGTLSIIVDGRLIMFNDGGDKEFAMQDLKPSDVLVLAGELGDRGDDNDAHAGHLVLFCTAEDEQRLTHDLNALRHELSSVDVNLLPDGAMPKLAVTVAAGHGINLLQGVYGKKTAYGTFFRPWRGAAMLLVGLLAVSAFGKGASYYMLKHDEAALRAEFSAEYRLIRPGDTREIVDPVATVESIRRSLGTSEAPDAFLPGMREVGNALLGKKEVTVEAISYRAGVIDLRLTSPDVATLDSIQKTVSESGRFAASIQRTDQVADKIDGRIQIRESGM